MPTLEYETQISGYVSGYTVTVAIDSAQVSTDFGLPYDHIELQTSGGGTVQTSTGTSVVVTDTSCIFQDIYSNWVVGYALYCDDSGTPVRQFYSSSPNAISASAAPSGFSADSVVVQLQDGSKASIGLSSVTAGDKCVVIPLQDGSKVAIPIRKLNVGEKVVVMPLQDGSKVAIPLSICPSFSPAITETSYLYQSLSAGTLEIETMYRLSFYTKGKVAFDGGLQQSLEVLLVGNGWSSSKTITVFTNTWTRHYTTNFQIASLIEALDLYFVAKATDCTKWCKIYIDKIEVVDLSNNVITCITNGDFETGTLSGWANYASDNIGYIKSSDYAYSGSYSCLVYHI